MRSRPRVGGDSRAEGGSARRCAMSAVLEGRSCASVLQDDRAAEAGLQPVQSPVATTPRTPSAPCYYRYSSSRRVIARAEARPRSEEHTSELQSRLHLVCRLLLE